MAANANEPVEIDLRAAINAVSDVVQNRPRPLREFDQIYMTPPYELQAAVRAHLYDAIEQTGHDSLANAPG